MRATATDPRRWRNPDDADADADTDTDTDDGDNDKRINE